MTSISGSSIFVPLGLQPIVPVQPIPSDNTSDQSAQQDDETTRSAAIAQQVKTFEAYLNQTSIAQQQSRTNQTTVAPTQSQSPDDAASQRATDDTANTSGEEQQGLQQGLQQGVQQGLLTDLVAFESYLNGRSFAATQDPIASTSSIPLPNYQTKQGTLNPLPITGPEQTAKTADTQSSGDRDKRNEKLETFLDAAAIANLVANLQSVRYDPVRELESRSTYKPPGESTPL